MGNEKVDKSARAYSPMREFFSIQDGFTRNMALLDGFYQSLLASPPKEPPIPHLMREALRLCGRVLKFNPWENPGSEATLQQLDDAIIGGFKRDNYEPYMQSMVNAMNATQYYYEISESEREQIEVLFREYQVQKASRDGVALNAGGGLKELKDYLINPVQTIARYVLPLKEVLKYNVKYEELLQEIKTLEDELALIPVESEQYVEKARIIDRTKQEAEKEKQKIYPGHELISEVAKQAMHYADIANQRQAVQDSMKTVNEGIASSRLTSAAKLFDLPNLNGYAAENSKLEIKTRSKKEEALFKQYHLIYTNAEAINKLGVKEFLKQYNFEFRTPKEASVLLGIVAINDAVPAADRVGALIELSKLFLDGKISRHDKADYAAMMLTRAKDIYTKIEDKTEFKELARSIDKAIVELHQYCHDKHKQVENLPQPIMGSPIASAEMAGEKNTPVSDMASKTKNFLLKLKSAASEVRSKIDALGAKIEPSKKTIETTTVVEKAASNAAPSSPKETAPHQTTLPKTQEEYKSSARAGRNNEYFKLARDQQLLAFDAVKVSSDKSSATFLVQLDDCDTFEQFLKDHRIAFKEQDNSDSDDFTAKFKVEGRDLQKLVKAIEHELKQDRSAFIDLTP